MDIVCSWHRRISRCSHYRTCGDKAIWLLSLFHCTLDIEVLSIDLHSSICNTLAIHLYSWDLKQKYDSSSYSSLFVVIQVWLLLMLAYFLVSQWFSFLIEGWFLQLAVPWWLSPFLLCRQAKLPLWVLKNLLQTYDNHWVSVSLIGFVLRVLLA